MGLRERKKQETRSALSWAAIRLIVERGYDKVLVEDIAAAAGVSPRTFNNYFSSKAEAVAARHLDRAVRIADGLRDRPAGEPLWTAITEATLAELVPGPELVASPGPVDGSAWADGLRRMIATPALQGEMLRASYQAQDAIAVAVGERTGTDPSKDLYPKLVAACLMGAFNVATTDVTRFELRGEAVRELLIDAFTQIAAGLPAPR